MKLNGRILAQEYSIQVYYTGVLSFERGFIFCYQKSHKEILHWIFCERSQSGLRIKRKVSVTFVAADHDSSVSVPFPTTNSAKIVTPGIKMGKN